MNEKKIIHYLEVAAAVIAALIGLVSQFSSSPKGGQK